MARRRESGSPSRAPWVAFAVGAVVLLVAWAMTARGLQLGVIRRGVLELWVHGAQPGWLDWVPFIHPPGYSLYMNTVDALASAADIDAAWLIFGFGAVVTLAAAAVTTGCAARWLGSGPAVWVALMATLSPQNLRPFEHYPLARLLLIGAFAAVIDRFAPPEEGESNLPLWVVLGACLLTVELHLSSWFLIGPLLGLLVLRMDREAGLVLLGLLGLFFASTLLGLWDVLQFGVGHKPGRGQISFEWANPLLLLAVVPALLVGPMRRAATGLVIFCLITFTLQALQIADGSPFPTSLHYFELIGPPTILVVAATLARLGRDARWLPAILAVGLLITQIALFARGVTALFVQPRWILMLF